MPLGRACHRLPAEETGTPRHSGGFPGWSSGDRVLVVRAGPWPLCETGLRNSSAGCAPECVLVLPSPQETSWSRFENFPGAPEMETGRDVCEIIKVVTLRISKMFHDVPRCSRMFQHAFCRYHSQKRRNVPNVPKLLIILIESGGVLEHLYKDLGTFGTL